MDDGGRYYREFLRGERDALTRIIKEYKDGLTFFLLSVTGDPHAAEEAMQETFVRLYVKKPRFDGRSGFRTWLYAIGRNTARELLRKAKRGALSTESPPEDLPDPAGAYFRRERDRLVHRAMARLKPEYRQALWLRYFEETPVKEIARILRKTENGTNALLHRARIALKTELEREGLTDEDLY